MKIIDKINKRLNSDKVFYSFEYFPPKTQRGKQNLYFKLEKMSKLEPLFIDVTWGAGGSTSDLTLEICSNTQNILSLESQMHLTCTNIQEDVLKQTLKTAKENNIRNILALRGDPPLGNDKWEASDSNFKHAIDLIKYLRKNYGDYFGISVAGYPEGHPESDYNADLNYLKQKVDAGADFVITQLFYDVDLFLKFYKDCRAIGINCPIIPGILPIVNYANFKKLTDFCKIKIPEYILNDLEPIKNDDKKVSDYGIELAIKLCKKLIANDIKFLHFYTLNRENSCVQIIEGLDLTKDLPGKRAFPWKPRIGIEESVRPIFWNNTIEYYIQRTSDWNQFPNGRWGSIHDAQYGEIKDYHLFSIGLGTVENKREMWGEVKNFSDVSEVFINFLNLKIKYIPWCDNLANETSTINEKLIEINKLGYLTINSQPNINAMPSNHENGWGGSDGYLYQKAYLELFTSKDRLDPLLSKIDSDRYSYCAVNKQGDIITNCKDATLAVTWGVFPKTEIIQPTIVDYESFLIWKEDAFNLWLTEWANIYHKKTASYKLIQEIHDNYYLVFFVDNEYIDGDIFDLFNT
ncbi:MAG TPA: methylenetetrahydrofolate reductase [Flavobacteriales bacterium]|nr:methylenetetrahydrofolate reductase [Flavobacteriales bacterium]